MLKPASNIKQSQSWWKLYGGNPQQQQQQQQAQAQHSRAAESGSQSPMRLVGQQQQQQQLRSMLTAGVVGVDAAQQLLPDLLFPVIPAGQARAGQARMQGAVGSGTDAAAGSAQPHQQQHNQGHGHGQQQQQQQPPMAEQQQQQQGSMPPVGWSSDVSAALHVRGGITLQVGFSGFIRAWLQQLLIIKQAVQCALMYESTCLHDQARGDIPKAGFGVAITPLCCCHMHSARAAHCAVCSTSQTRLHVHTAAAGSNSGFSSSRFLVPPSLRT
jgi:hypothetical protein